MMAWTGFDCLKIGTCGLEWTW